MVWGHVGNLKKKTFKKSKAALSPKVVLVMVKPLNYYIAKILPVFLLSDLLRR